MWGQGPGPLTPGVGGTLGQPRARLGYRVRCRGGVGSRGEGTAVPMVMGMAYVMV